MARQAVKPLECGGFTIFARDGRLYNTQVPCKRWSCARCSRAKANYYYAILCNGLRVVPVGPIPNMKDVQLITITTDPSKWESISAAWEGTTAAWKRLKERIKYHYGKFEYVLVWEATERGYPHAHVITRGLPPIPQGWHEQYRDSNGDWRMVESREDKKKEPRRTIIIPSPDGKPTLSAMADGSEFGRVVDIRAVTTDNDKGAINYVMKYILKACGSAEFFPPNFRRVQYSYGWLLEDWQRQEKPPEGVGVWCDSEIEAEYITRHVRRAMLAGLMPEGIMADIKQIGVKEWVARRAAIYSDYLQ